MTQKEFYKLMGMPIGWHFKFRTDECVVDDRGWLLVYDYMYCDWIHSRYNTLQTEFVVEHSGQVKPMKLRDFHYRRFSENKYTFEKKKENQIFDHKLEVQNDKH